MRKLLIIAAGATLLAAPVFAQNAAQPSGNGAQDATQPSGGAGQMNAPSDPSQTPATAPMSTPSAMAPADPGSTMAPGAEGATTPDANTGGTRMYSQAAPAGDVQVVSNGPVPDTAANRAKYRPLSHAGRHSKSAGN